MRRRWPALGLTLTGVALLAGCGRPDAAAADATAEHFYQAVEAAEGADACSFLAPATVENLEDDAGEPCADAILAGEVGDTLTSRADDATDPVARVAGRQAQAVLPMDVVFLTVSGDHWLITAAGCDARPQRPYDCVLEGS